MNYNRWNNKIMTALAFNNNKNLPCDQQAVAYAPLCAKLKTLSADMSLNSVTLQSLNYNQQSYYDSQLGVALKPLQQSKNLTPNF